MKKLILTLCFFSTLAMAGNIQLVTNDDQLYLSDCTLNNLYRSDNFNYTNYSITCPDDVPNIIGSGWSNMSKIKINQSDLICSVYEFNFVNNNKFYLYALCNNANKELK